MFQIARAAGNKFALSIIVGSVDSLIGADRDFLESATAGLTPDVASRIVKSIGGLDGVAARVDLELALLPRRQPVPA
jgi:hypothetical protein